MACSVKKQDVEKLHFMIGSEIVVQGLYSPKSIQILTGERCISSPHLENLTLIFTDISQRQAQNRIKSVFKFNWTLKVRVYHPLIQMNINHGILPHRSKFGDPRSYMSQVIARKSSCLKIDAKITENDIVRWYVYDGIVTRPSAVLALCEGNSLVVIVVPVLTHLHLVSHICVSELVHQRFRLRLIAFSAPSHYLIQCRLIVNWTTANQFQWNLNWKYIIIIKETAFQNVVCRNCAECK